MSTSPADEDSAGAHRVGWFELFFDLVVAAAIVFGTHVYAQEPSWGLGVWMAITLAVLVFLWLLTSLHHNLLPGDDPVRWLLVLGEMLAMIVAVLSEERDGGLPDSLGFASLSAAFAFIALLYVRAPRHSPRLPDPVVRVVWRSLAAGAIILFAGVFIPDGGIGGVDVAQWILAAGLLVAVVPVLTVGVSRVIAHAHPSREHLIERMGQLVMIVLGESFVSLVLRLGEMPNVPRPIFLFLTFVVVFAIWLVYFTTVLPSGMPTTPARFRLWLGATWLLMLGGSGAAAGMAALTVDAGGATAGDRGTILSLLYVMVAVAILAGLQRQRSQVRMHVIACALLAVIVACGYALPSDLAWWAAIAAAMVVVADAGISLRRAGTFRPARLPGTGP